MRSRLIAAFALLALLFAMVSVSVSAKADDSVLSFHEDGKFTIVHLTDTHIHYPMKSFLKQYIIEMLDTVKPDLVILGGDILTDSATANDVSDNPLASAAEELCSLFTDRSVYFTIVFGNHDRTVEKTGEYLLSLYAHFGGEYFLRRDAVPALTGEGTHDLQIMSSDGSKAAFNLYMFDSGAKIYDENGEYLGYDSVHEDQIAWYKSRAAELKAANGGETIPSLAFQHIIVSEIDDSLFYKVSRSVGGLGEDFADKHILFTPIPKLYNIKSGVILEKPCPGYYNYGQLSAMQETGDVLAIFSGHDHSNTFTVNIGGIDVVNTGGCKEQLAFRLFTSGARIITLDENDPWNYESKMLSLIELASGDESEIFSSGLIEKKDIILAKICSVAARISLSCAGIISL